MPDIKDAVRALRGTASNFDHETAFRGTAEHIRTVLAELARLQAEVESHETFLLQMDLVKPQTLPKTFDFKP